MNKELSEMTKEELWELFPISLVKPNPKWKKQYDDEKTYLLSFLPLSKQIRISHIGSTAINGILAKDIVDVLIEIPISSSMAIYEEQLISHNYLSMSESKQSLDLNKGYTKNGFAGKVFHIHVRFMGDNDELYFRDYMNDHPKKAKEYEELKLSLWRKFEHDRDGYTNAKHEFITQITALAKKEYQGRY